MKIWCWLIINTGICMSLFIDVRDIAKERAGKHPLTPTYMLVRKFSCVFIDQAILDMFYNLGTSVWLSIGLILASSSSLLLSLPSHN